MKKNFLFLILLMVVILIPIFASAYSAYNVRSTYYENIYGMSCNASLPVPACRMELAFPPEQPGSPPANYCGIGWYSISGTPAFCSQDFIDIYGQCGKLCTGDLTYSGYQLTQSSCHIATPPVGLTYPEYLCEFANGGGLSDCGYPLGRTGTAWVPSGGCAPTGGDYITMSVTPLTQAVAAGGAAVVYTVNIETTYIGTLNLTRSGCPAGATCVLSSASLNFIAGTADDSRSVTLTVTPLTAIAGTYNITTTGNINGNVGTAIAQLAINGGFVPNGYIDYPADGSTVSGSNVSVEGWALDNWDVNDSKVQSIRIYLDSTFLGLATLNVIPREDVCPSSLVYHSGWFDCPVPGWRYVWDASAVTPGAHTLKLEIYDNNGGSFSRTINVNVVAPTNRASCTSITAPASVTIGSTFSATVVMKNEGTKNWNGDATPHNLGSQNPQDNFNWGLQRVALPLATPPGGSATFTFNATAPVTPGTYAFDWEMVEDGLEWFSTPSPGNLGGRCTDSIIVTANPPAISLPTSASITSTGATLGATVTSDGGSAITARGTCWGLAANPATNCTSAGGTTGLFTHARTGLTAGTLYHYRGYATNAVGTTYTADATFTTLTLPNLTASAIAAPVTATVGSARTFTATITNGGQTSTGVVFPNHFQVATAINGGGTVTTISALNTAAALAAAGTVAVTSSSYTFPSAGSYSVRACADNNASMVGVVTESNEADNCGVWTTITVSAAATAPVISSPTATVTATGATLGANVTSDGGSAITSRGTCFATTINPTTNCSAVAGTTGIFTHARAGFTPGTLYHYRGYATNAVGTSYTVDATFTTFTRPNLTAGVITPVTATVGSARTFTATITNGGQTSTGVVFPNHFQVATAINGGGTVTTISALNTAAALAAAGTVAVTSSSYTFPSAGSYSVRACADNNASMVGVVTESNEADNCGVWTTITVSAAATAPSISLPTSASITSTGATLGATITSDGGSAITFRGTCWGTTAAPVTNCTPDGSTAVALFTQARTGMTAGTLYTYRGYATNAVGTTYTADATFTTLTLPELTASVITGAPLTATVGSARTFDGTITNGGETSTGVVFPNRFRVATATNGGGTVTTISALNTAAALGAGANVAVTSSSYTFPSAGTYSVSLCADNDTAGVGVVTESNEGNNCGAWLDVTVSSAATAPVISLPTATAITSTGATLGANVTSDGGSALTARGTCWATGVLLPTSNCLSGGTTIGIFTHARTGLTAGTTYNYRGYATNAVGTTYTATSTFTTLTLPDLTASVVSGAPLTATVNSGRTFSATITNSGQTSTGVVFPNRFRVATATNGGGTVTNISASNTAAALGAGANVVVTSSSYTFLSAGTYSVSVCADENLSGVGVITESNNGNNCGGWVDVVVSAAATAPLIGSPTATAITTTGATLGATVTSDGGSAVTARGTCWGTTSAPVTNCTSAGGTTGLFTHARTGMTAGTLYTYRGYATNAVGTTYTADATFITTANPLATITLVSNPVSPVINNTVILTWTVANATNGCTASGGWAGPRTSANGSYNEPPIMISAATSFTLTCLNSSNVPTVETLNVVPTIPNKTLTVTPSIGGIVESLTAGIPDNNIYCDPNESCTHSYANGSTVVLRATPFSNWKFVGWSTIPSSCTGPGLCTILNIVSDMTVQAIFAPRPIDYEEF